MTSSSLLPLLLLSLLLLLQPAAPQARKLLAPSPNLTFVSMIATAHGGNLRDPSPVVQDPATKRWHFWVDYVPLTDPLSPAGWHAFQWHYSAPEIAGPWTAHGLAFNHSARPDAWDHSGQLSPSVIYDEREQTWYYFYSATGTNYSHNDVCAQLVRASRSPDGPWLPLGTVAQPTGTKANGYSGHWNTLRLDSAARSSSAGRRATGQRAAAVDTSPAKDSTAPARRGRPPTEYFVVQATVRRIPTQPGLFRSRRPRRL